MAYSNSGLLRPPNGSNINNQMTKQNYFSNMLSAFQKYQYTRSAEVLRSYMKKNREMLTSYIDEINEKNMYQNQDNISESNDLDSVSYKKEKELNQKLEKQYADELEISKGNNIRESQIRFSDKCQEIDATLFTLNKQIDKLTQQNKVFSNKLEKQRFYREWQVMYTEHEGAKSLNSRLKVELEKKKAQIQAFTKR